MNDFILIKFCFFDRNATVRVEATTVETLPTNTKQRQRHILIKINKDKPTVLEVEVSEETNGITNSKKCLMTEL